MKRTVKRSTKASPPLEWRLQHAGVKRLRHMPGYGVTFTLAGDMNAGRRSVKTIGIAKATGLTAGEPDLRVYMAGGILGMIEYKRAGENLKPEQVERHALLRSLGFSHIRTVAAVNEDDAANQTESIVTGWLAGNDNLAARSAA